LEDKEVRSMKKNSSPRKRARRQNGQKTEPKSALTKGLESLAHTVGAVAGLASKTFAGSEPPGAVQMLKDDHARVKRLFDQFEQTESDPEKEAIVQSTIRDLEIHAALEEEIVYPAIRALDDDEEHQDKMDEALEEHHVVKQLMAELRDMVPADERYAAKFTVMAESVRHHIREEEAEVLPKAQKGNLDLEQLGKEMALRKQQLSSQPDDRGSWRPPATSRSLKARRGPQAAARKSSTRSR
jgi:Hemerythrin HHE cation binding domain